jgi:predicted phosphodiesterase
VTLEELQRRADWRQLQNESRARKLARTMRRLDVGRDEARRVQDLIVGADLDESEDVEGAEGEVDEVEEIGLRDEVRRLRRQVRESRRDEYQDRVLREVAFGLARRPAEPPDWTWRARTTKGSPGAPTLLLSDLHWGEVVRESECDGLNRYDVATARDRLRRTVETSVDLLLNHLSAPDGYPGIVVALGGDMVSGGIHDEIAETDELPPIPAVVDLRDQLVAAIDLLADQFGRVFVPTVDGNHDRNTKRRRHKRRVEHSFGWLLGNMLEQHYRTDDRVTVTVAESNDLHFRLADTTYMLTHGDSLGTRGGDGIVGVLGPIRRGRQKIGATARAVGRPFDVLLMGHYHQLTWLNDTIVNGSLKGWDEYAKANRFRPEPAQQALWLTHPSKGITYQMPVLADATDGDVVAEPIAVDF